MAKDPKAWIGVPAGPRKMSAEDPRPEYIARQDWFDKPEAIAAKEAGIGLMFQIQAPERLPEDFNPNILNGPYGMHPSMSMMRDWYQAHLAGESEKPFWRYIERWSKFQPAPEFVCLHAGWIGKPVKLDNDRFNTQSTVQELLCFLDWLKETLYYVSLVLPSVAVETHQLVHYVGPPDYPEFDGEVLPMTFNCDHVGIFQDLIWLGQKIIFDWEHAKYAHDVLLRQTIEFQNLYRPCLWQNMNSETAELYFRTGIIYQQDEVPFFPFRISLEQMIRHLGQRVYHVGGLTPTVSSVNTGKKNLYHENMKNVIQDPKLWEKIRGFRVAGHEAIQYDDNKFRYYLHASLEQSLKLNPIFVVETTDRGECAPASGNSPGCWYWQIDDAMETSFANLCRILPEELVCFNY